MTPWCYRTTGTVHGVNDTVESDSVVLLPQNQYNKKRNLRQQEYL